MQVIPIHDAPLPTATPGRVFTASIGREQIPAVEKFFDHITIGLKGAVSTAAVAVEDAVDVLSLFTLSVGAEARIQCDLNDLIALSALYYGQLPTLGENSDNTGTDWFGGIKVPVQAPVDPARPFFTTVDRTAVTNIGTETVAVSGYFLSQDYGRKPIHAVTIQETSAGSTGADLRNWRLPPNGKLIGLIIAIPAASDFTDGNIDVSVQRFELVRDGEVVAKFNTLADSHHVEEVNFVSLSIYGDLLARYKRFDFRPEGFDLKNGIWNLRYDNQDASDALRVIPVIEMA